MASELATKSWTIEDSMKLYQIDSWGDGFFRINEKGNLCVKLADNNTIDFIAVLDEIKRQNIALPVVIRFHDILRANVVTLNETFRTAIKEANYPKEYIGVYPVKVNQMREVVEEIVDAGAPYNYGLEAGSKPELLAVLAHNDNTESLTILNGYKDEKVLRLALLGRKLGRKLIIVIEKFSELTETIKIAAEMNIEPMIGLRAKLSTKGAGKWAASGGDRAKFGLTSSEIIEAIELLKSEGKESWVKLFHFHIGSQVTDIRTIKDAITEGARFYCQLRQMGLPIEYFDVGGGLGVDYEGSRSTNDSSTNYYLEDYVSDVVWILKQICEDESVPHPNIVSESGRAITALHACVITQVIDRIETAHTKDLGEPTRDDHMLIKNIKSLWDELHDENYMECFHDANQIKEELEGAFKLGVIDLKERAIAETYFWKILKRIKEITDKLEDVPEELWYLKSTLSSQYLCNCSFFQSTPDSWAIDQLFPIIPITRHNERPMVDCTLADITCDSDGKFDRFIGKEGPQKSLPLHDLNSDDYFLGIFMTGAYQDIMGDMHNLFGKLNEVHIFEDIDDPEHFYIEEVVKGHVCEEILSETQYNPVFMGRVIKQQVDKLVTQGKIVRKEAAKYIDFYEECLKDYTYLEKKKLT